MCRSRWPARRGCASPASGRRTPAPTSRPCSCSAGRRPRIRATCCSGPPMRKRVIFNNKLLPYLLLTPQLAITLIFFFWPAAQAIYYSTQIQDAFGLRSQFVWFENFEALFADPNYLASVRVTLIFSFAVTVLSMVPALLLAVMADKQIRGATTYKTMIIWPYAVATAVAAE